MKNRLYRSRHDRMVAGVCGGLADFLGLDPTLIRLVFVILALANGVGFAIYLLMLIVVPENPDETATHLAAPADSDLAQRIRAWSDDVGGGNLSTRNAIFIGGFLIFMGLLFLLRNFDFFPWHWFTLGALWPVLLILAGLAMLWRFYRGEN
ncbi:MAG: PspC domain-containing protein [Caldilineales bacterium]|nr:PspC domain-containing protein [Caldilineales bacterium]